MGQFGVYFVTSQNRMRQWIALDRQVADAEHENRTNLDILGKRLDEVEELISAKCYLDDVFGTEIGILMETINEHSATTNVEDLFHADDVEVGPWWMQINDRYVGILSKSELSQSVAEKWAAGISNFHGAADFDADVAMDLLNQLKSLCKLASERGEHLYYQAVV